MTTVPAVASTPEPLPDEHAILGYNIMLAAGLMAAESNALLRARATVTMRQYIALRHLRTKPDMGSGELGRQLFITAQSTGTLLDGLEKLGHIVRVGRDSPGQKMAVRLTPGGEAALACGDRLIAELEQRHRDTMAPGEAALLNDLLRKLLDTLRGA